MSPPRGTVPGVMASTALPLFKHPGAPQKSPRVDSICYSVTATCPVEHHETPNRCPANCCGTFSKTSQFLLPVPPPSGLRPAAHSPASLPGRMRRRRAEPEPITAGATSLLPPWTRKGEGLISRQRGGICSRKIKF